MNDPIDVRIAEMLVYTRNGLQLIPLHKWNARDAQGRERGKSPRDKIWQKRMYINDEVLRYATTHGNNIGVRLPASVVVVDVDPRNFPPGRNVLQELNAAVGLDLENAPHTITGSGGDHYWFSKPTDVDLMDSLPDYPGIEFKSRGRQVVAAGSMHPNGNWYEWDALAPDLSEMRELPPRCMALARRPPNPGIGAGAGEMNPERVGELLALLKPEDFGEHDRWRDLMMACHHATGGEGRQEFIDWSIGDPKYSTGAWEVGRRWDSLHIARSERNITGRLLFKRILETGQLPPNAAPEEDFEVVDPAIVDPEGGHSSGGEAEVDGRDEKPSTTLLDELNMQHCVVSESGKFRVFTEMFDPVLGRQYYARSSKQDFIDLMSNRAVEVPGEDGESKAIPLGSWWLRQPKRRQYAGVLFDPERQHPGWLNLWKGWRWEPKRGNWDLLKELLFEVLCDGDERSFDYVMDWAAYMVQHPGRAAEVAICFRGDKGTGKGTWGRALASLAGGHGLHISSPEHLTGRFNSHLKDVVCLFADEAFWAGDKAGESVLKQLVTEPTVTFEGKGRDAEQGRNLIHIVIASNSEWVVPAGLDGERRFAVFEVNKKAQGDRARFRAIHAQLNGPTGEGEGYSAMLWELLTRDLGDWAPRDDVPTTRALIQQKLRSMDPFSTWWFERLNIGAMPGQRSDWWDGETIVAKDYVRRDYAEACRARGVRSLSLSANAFGQALKKLCPPSLATGQRTAMETELGVSTDIHGRVSVYVLPGVKECREVFEGIVGGEIPWESKWLNRMDDGSVDLKTSEWSQRVDAWRDAEADKTKVAYRSRPQGQRVEISVNDGKVSAGEGEWEPGLGSWAKGRAERKAAQEEATRAREAKKEALKQTRLDLERRGLEKWLW